MNKYYLVKASIDNGPQSRKNLCNFSFLHLHIAKPPSSVTIMFSIIQALRILVKQFNECSWNLVEVVLKQFTRSPVWEYRREAAQLLQHLGRKHACRTEGNEELVYSILERRLWDDSVVVNPSGFRCFSFKSLLGVKQGTYS